MLEVNGKNIHKSYTQKVKNGMVKFFGESTNAEVQNNQLLLKAMTLDQDSQ